MMSQTMKSNELALQLNIPAEFRIWKSTQIFPGFTLIYRLCHGTVLICYAHYARGHLRSHWHRTTMPLNAEPSDTCSDDDIAAALWAEQPELQHSDNDIEPVSQSKLSSKLRKVPANMSHKMGA